MTFKKGQSGNPGGRPKSTPDEVEAIRKLRGLTQRAVEKVEELLESDDEKVRMAAAKEVLDRNLGKPVQPTDNVHSGPDGVPMGIEVRLVKVGSK